MKVVYPSSTPRQFVLRAYNRHGPPLTWIPDSWNARSFAGMELIADGALRVIHCKHADGGTVGFFLGDPIDSTNLQSITGELTFPSKIESWSSVDQWVEEQVYRYAGRFIFVLLAGDHRRVYLDAAGLLPLVYDPERRLAGSTAAALLAPAEFMNRFDRDLFTTLGILDGGWIPGGLTAHRGINRLLCNFYLDLNDWTTHRHWPRQAFEVSAEPMQAVQAINETIRSTIATYSRLGSLCMALTGGYETRLLLSLTKGFEREVDFVCFYSSSSDRDLTLSQKLARRFRLRLRTLKFPPVSCDEADQWLARSGYCTGENRHTFAVTGKLAKFDYFAGGVAGEVGRGFFWRPGDGSSPITAQSIYNRLGLPPSDALKRAIETWFTTLPTADPLLALDLAYLELRVCCWASVQTYSAVGPAHVYPMVSRRTFTAMLSLPPSWRRHDEWLRIAIENNWPEILSIPVNSLGPVREAIRTVRRVVRQPSLIVRRWRKRFA